MDLKTTVELFEFRVRGMMARAFSARRVEPNANQWAMIRGTKEVTLRSLGELSHQLDFEFELATIQRQPTEEEGE